MPSAAESSLLPYNSRPLANYSLFDETVTPMSYRDRITVEFILNSTSWLLSTFLVVFVRMKKTIWTSLKSTIVFVTIGSFLLNIPLVLFQSWMVFNLQSGHQPKYTVFVCSLLKNVCSSTTSAYQVLPFAVSLYRYRTVVLKGHSSVMFVIIIQAVVTSIFIIYAFLNYPFGQNNRNDVCHTLRFSNGMELVRIFSTLLFNCAGIIVNCVILRFLKSFENESKGIQEKRVQLTKSLLIQSTIPVLVSLPLLLLSFEFYFGIPMPSSFGTTWYALTFLGPSLMPLSSILGIRSTRRELLDTLLCGCFPRSDVHKRATVSVILASKIEKSTFIIRDDE